MPDKEPGEYWDCNPFALFTGEESQSPKRHFAALPFRRCGFVTLDDALWSR
jgi:hypothetical protein